jgi:putative ABC transport system ATP-binding protein
MTALEGRALVQTYQTPAGLVVACSDVSIAVEEGELVAVTGASGSGKTTLLNMLNTTEDPTSGDVFIGPTPARLMAQTDLIQFRNHALGIVFQDLALFDELTAQENVELPLRIRRASPVDRDERARLILDAVGLGSQKDQRVYELSGGQRQRVAVARALVTEPRIIIADEPTAQLDKRTAERIADLIRAAVSVRHVAAVVATHDPDLLKRADRVIHLRSGHVELQQQISM